MAKVSIDTLVSLENQASFIAILNVNFAAIQAAMEKTLSRDGTTPNTMTALIDMNGNKIINLPAPVGDTEPARHGDIQQYVTAAAASALAASVSADAAAASATLAAGYATAANDHFKEFQTHYLGAFSSAPLLDNEGAALAEGALYYNTVTDTYYGWNIGEVYVDTDQVFVDSDAVVTSSWVALPALTLASIGDVNAAAPVNNQILRYISGTGDWTADTLDPDDILYSNGALSAASVGTAIDEIVTRTTMGVFELHIFAENYMNESESLYRLAATSTFTVPSDTTGFIAKSAVAPVGGVTVLLKKNGVQFGTVTWTASNATGVWSIAGDTVFNAGDIFELTAPGVVDTAMKDTVFSIVANK